MTRTLADTTRAAALAIALGLAGCGTPEAVKTLSQAQLDAFDAVVKSAETQSDAIVALSRKVSSYEVNKFAAELAAAQQDAVEALTIEPDNQKALAQAFESGAKRERDAAGLQAELDANIEKIDAQSKRLVSLIREMKKAQAAIHQYLETEAVGEKLTKDILGNPVVSSALGSASRLVTEVNKTSEELEITLDAIVNR